jgi:hypothetical protein
VDRFLIFEEILKLLVWKVANKDTKQLLFTKVVSYLSLAIFHEVLKIQQKSKIDPPYTLLKFYIVLVGKWVRNSYTSTPTLQASTGHPLDAQLRRS